MESLLVMDSINQIPSEKPEQAVPGNQGNGKIYVAGVIIVLILAATGFILYSQLNKSEEKNTDTAPNISVTPSDVQQWISYSNEYYAFKYPSDWEIFKTGYENSNNILLTSKNAARARIYIGIYQKLHSTIEEYEASLNVSESATETFTVYSKEWTSLNGERALRVIRSQPGEGKIVEITALTDKDAYILSYSPLETHPEYVSVFDKILASFTFSAIQPSGSPTAPPVEIIQYKQRNDWQTYTDTVRKFSIQYPDYYRPTEGKPPNENEVYFHSCGKAPDGMEICSRGINVLIYNDYTGGSRREWYKKKFLGVTNEYYEELNIQGINALLIMDGSDNQGGSSSAVLIPKGNTMYVIDFPTGWNPATGNKGDIEFIKEVLATFTFI